MMIDSNASESNTNAGRQGSSTTLFRMPIPCREPIQIAFAVRENRFLWLAFRRLDGCYPNKMPAPAIRLPIGTIVTARDSWSRMVPLPRLRAPGQQQAQAALPEAAGGDAAGYRRRLRLRAPGNKKPFG